MTEMTGRHHRQYLPLAIQSPASPLSQAQLSPLSEMGMTSIASADLSQM